MLRNEKPPIIPKISNMLDTSNFRNFNDDLSKLVDMDKEQGIEARDLPDNDPFKGFESGNVPVNENSI